MRLRLIRAGLILLALLSGAGDARPGRAAGPADPIAGDWLTEHHDGIIRIAACGPALCGWIVGMSAPLGHDGTPARDVQGRPECGLQILRDARRDPDDGRFYGLITDPEDGSIWHCALWLGVDGRLRLRGYVLVPLFGQTQTWTRSAAAPSAGCGM